MSCIFALWTVGKQWKKEWKKIGALEKIEQNSKANRWNYKIVLVKNLNFCFPSAVLK